MGLRRGSQGGGAEPAALAQHGELRRRAVGVWREAQWSESGKRVRIFGFLSLTRWVQSDLWCYSVKEGKWEKVEGEGVWPGGRWGHATVVGPDGESGRECMWVFGGRERGLLKELWKFDFGRREWSQIEERPERDVGRHYHCAVVAEGDTVVLVGGNAGAGNGEGEEE